MQLLADRISDCRTDAIFTFPNGFPRIRRRFIPGAESLDSSESKQPPHYRQAVRFLCNKGMSVKKICNISPRCNPRDQNDGRDLTTCGWRAEYAAPG